MFSLRLKLNLSTICFEFSISHYVRSTKERWDKEWCAVSVACRGGNWLNYVRNADETLLSCEVETILDHLEDLLNDRLHSSGQLAFIEPDFILILNPKKDLTKDAKYLYVAPGYEIQDIDMEWKIVFRDGKSNDHYLSLRFYREDLTHLQKYLSFITGKISQSDAEIQKMIESGVLCPF